MVKEWLKCGIAVSIVAILTVGGIGFAEIEFDADNDGVFDPQYKINQNNMVDGSALAEIIDDDGPGSGLDADKVDGFHAADFVPRTAFDTLQTDDDIIAYGNLHWGDSACNPMTLAEDGYCGTPLEIPAGETFNSGAFPTAYYLAWDDTSGRVEAFHWNADSTETGNVLHPPQGIVLPVGLPVAENGTLTVTAPGTFWAFRNDNEPIATSDVGKRYYIGSSGWWTADPATDLPDDGDVWMDFGIVISASPDIVVRNPDADMLVQEVAP